MEYNQAYHLTCSLILDSSRSIVLKHLDQSQTYAGLLEGTPNKKANEWGIEADMKRASEYPQTIGKPHLVEPVRRDYLRAPAIWIRSANERQNYRRNGAEIQNGCRSCVA